MHQFSVPVGRVARVRAKADRDARTERYRQLLYFAAVSSIARRARIAARRRIAINFSPSSFSLIR